MEAVGSMLWAATDHHMDLGPMVDTVLDLTADMVQDLMVDMDLALGKGATSMSTPLRG